MSRPKLLVLSLIFCFCLVALGTVVFGIEPLTKTQFMLMVFIAAWSGDACESVKGK